MIHYNHLTWQGYERLDFQFDDVKAWDNANAIVIPPKKEGWGSGRLAMKMEYFNAFPQLELDLLEAGFHIAYLFNINRWGTDVDHERRVRFAELLSKEFSLNPRFIGVGLSCGGIHTANFASRHPEYTALMYLDAPVMNLLSCPMGFGIGDPLGEGDSGFREIEEAYGFTRSSLLLYREHPIDRIPTLIENRIPAALVYGDSDPVVPYVENGKFLEDAYRAAGMPLFCVGKPGCSHHPHGLEDNTELLAFIRENMLD